MEVKRAKILRFTSRNNLNENSVTFKKQLIIDALNLLLLYCILLLCFNIVVVVVVRDKSTIGCTTKENNKFAERQNEKRKPQKN
jgi:hypothetical protein